ncbi:MAG: hypothetical protein GY711_28910 [bacterium]|nr:hypothetical protein [bacterium]
MFLALTVLAAAPLLPRQDFFEYDELTDSPTEVTNLFPEPWRAISVDADGNVWCVNPYASTVVKFPAERFFDPDSLFTLNRPELIVPTGLHPVSVLPWDPPGAGGEEDRLVLVVCAGTRGVFLHDAQTGEVRDMVPLESEHELAQFDPSLIGPSSGGADIVVDPDNLWAFVSCPDANTVLRIELDPASNQFFEVVDTYHLIVGQRPGPLLLDRGNESDPDDNTVLVAMTITGNNSIFSEDTDAAGATLSGSVGEVVDLDVVFPVDDGQGTAEYLPDQDVWKINATTGAVDPHVTEAGSMLFDLERNPITDELWILSTRSNNKDPNLNTEPKLRGRIVTNELARVDDSLPAAEFTPFDYKDLDDSEPNTPGEQYSGDLSINQARTIEFAQITNPGNAFVASPFVDRVIALASDGKRFTPAILTLPAQSNCYDVELYGPNEELILCFCLGSMRLEVFYRPLQLHVSSYDLGHDPTPDQIQRGRAVFLNGQHSEHARSSCASCHPGAMSDQLGWMIGDEPLDSKDVMLTQSLLGIADTFPHHWRGERDLKDFQKAFRGLLGADAMGAGTTTEEPSDAEMEDLIAFILSLQAPANPIQSPNRRLDDNRRSVLSDDIEFLLANGDFIGPSSPDSGQQLFLEVPNFAARTCEECHRMPTGSSNDMVNEVGSRRPKETNLEMAHLRQLQHRGARSMLVKDPNFPTGDVPILNNMNGFGARHSGGGTLPNAASGSIFEFITLISAFAPLTIQDRVDVWRFVDQFDQGTSPTVHWARYLDVNSSPAERAEARAILENGFEEGWNDVVFFGQVDVDLSGPGGKTPLRAALVPGATANDPPVFLTEAPGLPRVGWDIIDILLVNDWADIIIMGLPPGNGERYANDFDRDETVNTLDADPWTPDVDGDGFPDGYMTPDGRKPDLVAHKRDFVSARVAKYHVEFDEPVTYTVKYKIGMNGTELTFESVRGAAAEMQDFKMRDTFVLMFDNPSGAGPNQAVIYDVDLTATDRSGNMETFELMSFEPLPMEDRVANDGMGGVVLVNDFLHVESAEFGDPGMVAPVGFTPFSVDVRVAENESAVAGEEGFKPAEKVMVFVNISVESQNVGMGEPFFTEVDTTGPDFLPNGLDTSFLLNDTPAPVTYTGHDNILVSALTNANGRVNIPFFLGNLASDQDVKVSVLGIMRPVDPVANPLVYLQRSISEYQPLKREDAAIAHIVR